MLNYEFPPLGGGASPVSYEIAEHFSKKCDFDIDVVTMGYKNLLSYEKINNHFRIFRVKCWRSKKEICYPWEQATYLISGFFKCIKLCLKKKYDVCHCHFIIPTGLLAYFLKIIFGIPYFVTSHGSDVINYNPRFKNIYPQVTWIWKKLIKNAQFIITPSNFLSSQIKEVYPIISNEKLTVIPNGIDLNKFVPLKKKRNILVVSRLFINKGIQDFLKALSNLELKDWHVNIVGEGPYRSHLEKLVSEYNLNEKVTFYGWLENKSREIKKAFGEAEIFVLTSYFENMNVTLLEAMLSGCAVLASDVGGNSEIVGDCGILFPAGNIEQLHNKIKQLISDQRLRYELQQKGIDRIKNKFSWENIIKQYVFIINSTKRA